jgi:hypothetical protein
MEGRGWESVDGESLRPYAALCDRFLTRRFHRPVEGEEGHEPQNDEKTKQDLSSLAQIVGCWFLIVT